MNLRCVFGILVLAFAATPMAATPAAAQETPLFSRHLVPLFSRLGCNAGSCHGAVKGQNGFRLSLFAADPASDHDRLIHEFAARRLNFQSPQSSLLLQKATGQVEHQGGARTKPGSPDYKLLEKWIAAGAPLDVPAESRVTKLTVTPNVIVAKPGSSQKLKVDAAFADKSSEDITALCSFESLDKHIATVETDGTVAINNPGDVAVIIRFRADPTVVQVLAPRVGDEAFPEVAANNFIDTHILAKLKRLNLPPAPLADDATFLRRAFLDIAGELPTPAEITAFLADKSADKRAKLIDTLLARPGHAALWTLKFCDLLKASDYGVYADGITQEQDAPRFMQWVRARLEENTPYDEFVTRILTATSRDGKSLEAWGKETLEINEGYTTPRTDHTLYSQRNTLDIYWQRRAASGVAGASQVAHTFLGLRLECAQCHRHPHDVWQQDDLLSFANFFMHVRSSGYQQDNEKKYVDVFNHVKVLNDEAKKLTEEVKKLPTTRGKELDAAVKDAKTDAAKEAAKEELKAFQEEMKKLDRRSKLLPEVGRRMMHAEIGMIAGAKDNHAKITSPLGSQESKRFRLLGDAADAKLGKDTDPRALVAEWMRRPDNPFFAKAIVNRVWAHYFGRGIVDPPDNLSSLNPPTHPELLDELCRGFIEHKYDLKWLHRTIALSRTYQQSSQAPAASAADRSNYAAFPLRRLQAEVLLDALSHATGTTEDMDMKFHNWPPHWKTVEIPFTPKNAFVTFMLTQFGRPERNAAVQCDCERDSNPSVLQVLSFANHPRVRQRIADDKGRVAQILADKKDDAERIDSVFLWTLGRPPTDGERSACESYLRESASPAEGLRGIMWSLLNTREFLLQH